MKKTKLLLSALIAFTLSFSSINSIQAEEEEGDKKSKKSCHYGKGKKGKKGKMNPTKFASKLFELGDEDEDGSLTKEELINALKKHREACRDKNKGLKGKKDRKERKNNRKERKQDN